MAVWRVLISCQAVRQLTTSTHPTSMLKLDEQFDWFLSCNIYQYCCVREKLYHYSAKVYTHPQS